MISKSYSVTSRENQIARASYNTYAGVGKNNRNTRKSLHFETYLIHIRPKENLA